jgi:hypothetical protein
LSRAFLVSLSIEPGLLVPSVRLMGERSTLQSLGRPWLSGGASCGWAL